MSTFFRSINRCDVFVFLDCLYWAQGVLYHQGIFNQILQMILIIWSLKLTFANISKFRSNPSFIKSLYALIYMFVFYGVIAIMFGYYGGFNGRPPYLYLQRTLMSLLPIIVFYEFSKEGLLQEKHIMIYLLPFFGITVGNYHEALTTLVEESLSGRTDFTMNVGYSFLSLVSFVCFFYKRPLLQYGILVIIMYWVIICMKRGAILIGILCSLYFLWNSISNASSSKKIFILLISFFCIYLGYKFFYTMILDNSYFQMRLQATLEGNTSGRDEIYSVLINGIFRDFNLFELLVGRGAYSTYSVVGAMAHNDWLEILCNNGMIGLIIFVSFMLSFFKQVIRNKNVLDNYLYVSFIMLFIITLVRTFISQSIMVMTPSQNILIGYIVYRYYSSITEYNC